MHGRTAALLRSRMLKGTLQLLVGVSSIVKPEAVVALSLTTLGIALQQRLSVWPEAASCGTEHIFAVDIHVQAQPKYTASRDTLQSTLRSGTPPRTRNFDSLPLDSRHRNTKVRDKVEYRSK
ncbi:hypothetical protein MRB53_040366 [Persea americana]|nr:hypothetical protein MRB53_040366 [Persea americana]